MSAPNAEQRQEALHLAERFAEACLREGNAVSTQNVVATAESYAKFLAGESK